MRINPEITVSQLKEIGFTNHVPQSFYYMKPLISSISFNVTIPSDLSGLTVEVLDEDFLQPYDYQFLLSEHPDMVFPLQVKSRVEDELLRLEEQGVITGYIKGEYI